LLNQLGYLDVHESGGKERTVKPTERGLAFFGIDA